MSSITLTPTLITLPGTAVAPIAFYYDTALLGTVDGVNKVFTVPGGKKFVNNLGVTIQVFVNETRVAGVVPSESGGVGTGFDTVTLPSPPAVSSTVKADYITT